MTDHDFSPTEVRYIKLGREGRWARHAIDEGIIPFGFDMVPHEACTAGDWPAVEACLLSSGRGLKAVQRDLRELQDFYELGPDTLWVTFADGHLQWAFAEGPVMAHPADDPAAPVRYRRTRDGWHRQSLQGEALAYSSLSSVLTRTGHYRRSLCRVKGEAYLLRRIRGEGNPLHIQAAGLKADMVGLAQQMIAQLHWEEFETLVDLIFTRGGWRRTSLLGQDMPDVDLFLDQPLTGETGWAQVKSESAQQELDDHVARFRRAGTCSRFFYACHSPKEPLTMPPEPDLHLWTGPKLAGLVMEVGLFDWLMARTC